MAGELRHRGGEAAGSGGEGGADAPAAAKAKVGGGEGKEEVEVEEGRKEALGWLEWSRGWMGVVGEFFFQRIAASHLANPLELPPLDGVSVVVTGATSGIGLEIARSSSSSPSLLPPATHCSSSPLSRMDGIFA